MLIQPPQATRSIVTQSGIDSTKKFNCQLSPILDRLIENDSTICFPSFAVSLMTAERESCRVFNRPEGWRIETILPREEQWPKFTFVNVQGTRLSSGHSIVTVVVWEQMRTCYDVVVVIMEGQKSAECRSPEGWIWDNQTSQRMRIHHCLIRTCRICE